MAETEPGGLRTRTTVPYQQQLDEEVIVLPLSGCCAGHAGSSWLGLQGGCCRRLSHCWRVYNQTLGRCLLLAACWGLAATDATPFSQLPSLKARGADQRLRDGCEAGSWNDGVQAG